jgi:hypothetical protein
MLRVFINGALQLAYYWPIDLKTEFELETGKFFLGITGSTGDTSQRQVITNWSLRIVKPTIIKSYSAIIEATDVESGKEVEVGIFLRTRCETPYIPNELDSLGLVKVNWLLIPKDECKIKQVIEKQVPSNVYPQFGTTSYIASVC